MIVVIDTNVLLQALSRKSPLRSLLDAWFKGDLVWALSTEILFEYQEIITQRSGAARRQGVAAMLDLVKQSRPSTLLHVSPSFHFHLIPADPDDNKFTECAIAADADFVITDDGHFGSSINAGYKAQPIAPAEFIERYL